MNRARTMGHPVPNAFARIAAVLAAFALGCAVSVGLWISWTGRCGEACPEKTIAGLLAFLALLPSAGASLAVLLLAAPWRRGAKVAIAVVALLAAAGAALHLGGGVGPGATAGGLR
ncbi:MAG: hypothetical protein ABW032_05565 [Burkholderiaceae bacterium]